MAFEIITQDYLDNAILAIADFQTDFAEKCIDLMVQNDPDAFRQEQALIAIQNIEWALRDYDIEAEILTETEITYLLELATQIIQDCPLQK